jgi:hypothetical protein
MPLMILAMVGRHGALDDCHREGADDLRACSSAPA